MKKIHVLKRISGVLKTHVVSNKKEYLIIALMFLIGLLSGVVFVNNIGNEEFEVLEVYFNNFIENSETASLEFSEIIKESLKNNMAYGLAICFFGTTIIGMPIVFGAIVYKGFSLRIYNCFNNKYSRDK